MNRYLDISQMMETNRFYDIVLITKPIRNKTDMIDTIRTIHPISGRDICQPDTIEDIRHDPRSPEDNASHERHTVRGSSLDKSASYHDISTRSISMSDKCLHVSDIHLPVSIIGDKSLYTKRLTIATSKSKEGLVGSSWTSIDEMMKIDNAIVSILFLFANDHISSPVFRTIITDNDSRKSRNDNLIDHRTKCLFFIVGSNQKGEGCFGPVNG